MQLPIQAQPVIRNRSTARIDSHLTRVAQSNATIERWNCYLNSDGSYQGDVYINWAHILVDVAWACNNWLSGCANGGGCNAVYGGEG